MVAYQSLPHQDNREVDQNSHGGIFHKDPDSEPNACSLLHASTNYSPKPGLRNILNVSRAKWF
jgi:hypothetical protein